ncbi:hypothetical protein ACQPZZ_14620 [Microbispora sp. CA-135349]|uniref:hypothetical protein n=1 Tax=Microbispora sp. CA-135349 TaxID=3239953 RepID=UPI003D8E9A7F
MTACPPNPLAGTAKAYLARARHEWNSFQERSPLQSQLVEAAAAYAVTLLKRLLDDPVAGLADEEMAEIALVYQVVAERVAPLVGRRIDEVLPALIELCDDEKARPLIRDLRPTGPELLALLGRHLLWITVTYQVPPKEPPRRLIEILFDQTGTHRNMRKFSDVTELRWEDVPADVRRRAMAKRQQAIRFRLYPLAG